MAITDRELRIIITAVGADKVQRALDGVTGKATTASGTIVKGFGVSALTQMKLFNVAVDLGGKGLHILGEQAKDAWRLGLEEAKASEKRAQILGDLVPQLDQWAKTSEAVSEQTKSLTEDQTAQYMLLLTNMGVARDTAFDYAKQMTEITAQQAAFQQLSPDEAFNKLYKGISGAGKGLKDLGIVMGDADIKQRLANEGVEKGAGGYTQAQLAIERMKMMIEKSAPAVAGFEKQHATMTGTLNTLAASWETAKEEMGVAMQESELAKIAIDNLRLAAHWLSETVKGNNEDFNRFVEVMGRVKDISEKVFGVLGWVNARIYDLGQLISQVNAPFWKLMAWGWDVEKNAWNAVTGGGGGATSDRGASSLTYGARGTADNPLHVRVKGASSMSLLEAMVPA